MAVAKSRLRGSRILVSMTIDEDQLEKLDRIVRAKRSNRSALLRSAVDLYIALNKHEADISDGNMERSNVAD